MPPRSPTLAFDPTPALAHNNFSTFNGVHRQSSIDSYGEGTGKEVHFEEPVANVHSRHSIATSHVSLLPAVSSASHVPKQAFRIMNPTPGVDITAYFEHCRDVNEQLRHAQEEERKAWQIERMALKTRIADLEFRLNKVNGGRRRMSNDTSYASITSFKSDYHVPPITGANGTRHHSIVNAPLDHLKQENGKPIWEPASPSPATRVFSHDDDIQHMPSISEDGPSHGLSPQRSNENKPIPIQQIDQTLDGITVKSGGVRSSFTKVMSPILVVSPGRSPSPKQQPLEPPRFNLDTSSLLDPLDAKLKKHAGHTPLAFDHSSNLSTIPSTDATTPVAEGPLAPLPTARPHLRPSERSESYFSVDDVDAPAPETILEEEEPEPQFEAAEDKSLNGPLMLDNSGESAASHSFLEQLDQKLETEVRKSLSSSPAHSPARSSQSAKTDEDNFPRLRLKKSTNFGSAYGNRIPGFCDR